jgi:hypothetical protein
MIAMLYIHFVHLLLATSVVAIFAGIKEYFWPGDK